MIKLPITKIDSHAHVFNLSLPMLQNRRYTPQTEAPLEKYLNYLDNHQFSHGVLIQPSFLGTDNSFLINTIKQANPRLKGVAVIEPTTSLAELTTLDNANIVGIRLNLINKPLPNLNTSIWQTLLHHIKQLDWHIELHCYSDKLNDLLPDLIKVGVKVVIDHFGRPLNYQVSKDKGFNQLLTFADSGLIWCKLSGIYRITQTKQQTEIFLSEAIPLLLENLGAEHLVWGSDWPHTQHESMISYPLVVAQMTQYLSEPHIKQTILCDTPAKLFKFTD